MSSLDFPLNPVDSQEYSLNGVTYYYNAALGAWLTKLSSAPLPTAFNRQVLFNDVGLSNGSYGLVFDKSANTLFANTINVSSNMRVTGNLYVGSNTVTITDTAVMARSLFVMNDAGHMTSVPSGSTSNLAFDTANAAYAAANNVGPQIAPAFNKANSALQNTSGTFAGNLSVSGNLDLSLSTSHLKLPSGTTSQRPSSVAPGTIRYNSDTDVVEQYTTSQGWTSIELPPVVTSVSPTQYNGANNTRISINGNYFKTGCNVYFITANGVSYQATQVTVSNSTYIAANTPTSFLVTTTPISVKVQTAGGLNATLSNVLTTYGAPTLSNASGTLSTVYGGDAVSTSVVATFPNGANTTAAYVITSGSLPSGVTLNANTGAISGTTTNPASSTTYTFSVKAYDIDGNGSTPVSYSIVLNRLSSYRFMLWSGGGGGGTQACGGQPTGSGSAFIYANTTNKILGTGNLNIYVGGAGLNNSTGGWPGGGNGGSGGGGGGGVSYILLASSNTLLMACGAGGGNGGSGGGTTNGGTASCGSYATQSSGGAACPGGFGGGGGGTTNGAYLSGGNGSGCAGGAGGAGYYGGGGGSGDCGACSGGNGGGGSSYSNPTYMSSYYAEPANGTSPGGSNNANWTSNAGQGGASGGSGYNGRVLIFKDGNAANVFTYTGSVQTFTIS